MKISIATGPWLPVPALQGGAVNRRWQGVAEEFAACGHEVRMLCRAFPGQPKTEVINGVQYIRRGGFPKSNNIWFDLIKDLTYALLTVPTLPPADILIINDFWLPVFSPLRSEVGKAVVNVGRFPKGQFGLYKAAPRFAVATQAIKNAIVEQAPTLTSRIRVIPNPVDIQIFCPSDSKPQRSEKVVLYVGRIHPEKGIHLLLDGFALLVQQVSSVKLRIIGPIKADQGGGGEEYLNQLKAQAEGLNVEFVDPIFDTEALAKAYQAADVFCYPSLAEKGEAFGVAPLEAMATGLVPIVSNLECFKDFIEDGQTGLFFDHRSPDAAQNLAATLETAIVQWEITQQISFRARQKALEYSYQNLAKRYLTDFEQLLTAQT